MGHHCYPHHEIHNSEWPSTEEQLECSQVIQSEGFLGCIELIDGKTIPLSQKPAKDGNHYFDCKKR